MDRGCEEVLNTGTEGFCGEALFQDMDAVVAAMVMPYSQGQTEGRVNKLKLIKSSMYGR